MAGSGTWLDEITRQLRGVAGAFWSEVQEYGVTPFLAPVGAYAQGPLAPLVAIGGVVGILVLSGVAVAAMGTALVALLALWLLLAQVFGFSVELNPFAGRA